MIPLTVVAIVTGVALLWIWKRFSNQERIAIARRQMRARIYAMRLYADEPATVLRAQGQLLLWTGRYLAGMLRPMAVSAVPLLVLLAALDNVYGHRALKPGESAIVTARFTAADPRWMGATLEGQGVTVETPGVRALDRHEVSWRVRARNADLASVRLRMGRTEIEKTIRCGRAWAVPAMPWDSRPAIEAPEAPCPAATLDIFNSSYSVDWRVWFSLVGVAVMLALRRRFAVSL